ncbi:MAG: hypothetical protein AUI33_01155 [Ignavibacteria bacterium 13_1_40CM_2_61_4]|nr:MAG: hypothetical protein AUI33_01155 [Ignavibacteria bacterium 13_1_40CM_2_61_4]
MKQLSAILLLFSIVVGKMFGQENASLPTKDNQVFSNDRFFLKTRTTAQTVSTSLPLTMSYQGLLTTGLGAPVADGLYDLQFDLYDSLTGGTSQWTETQAGVPAQRGTFNVILGSINPLNLQFTQKLFVNVITTNGPAGPSYPLAFSPRSELTSVPYALAPWQSNNNSVYFNNGRVGIGTATPGTTGGDLQYVKFEIADQLGFTSDEVFRVAGGGYAGSCWFSCLRWQRIHDWSPDYRLR